MACFSCGAQRSFADLQCLGARFSKAEVLRERLLEALQKQQATGDVKTAKDAAGIKLNDGPTSPKSLHSRRHRKLSTLQQGTKVRGSIHQMAVTLAALELHFKQQRGSTQFCWR